MTGALDTGLSTRSTAVTHGIRVTVQSQYLRDRSSPAQRQFAFAYSVRIENVGTETAQLTTRHWIITRADGSVEEVRGAGVVGHQPKLEPGQHFEYTSGCILPTPHGTMRGSYHFVRTGSADRPEEPSPSPPDAPPDGEFDAEIAPFLLAQPHATN